MSVSARVVARVPLLRSGLERLAADAGVDVTGDAGRAGDAATDLTLRSADTVSDGSPVDIVVAGDAVVVTCRAVPDDATWIAITRLVASALDG